MRFTGGVLRITRSLRFRLALSYVFFFTIALILIGGFVRYSLEHIMANQAEDAVDEEWGAVKGYLTVEKYGPDWFYDAYDPDEIARGGVYHITFERDTPIQLVRIALPNGAGLYPETSGSHYRCSVRLLAWNGLNSRPQQTTEDVPVTLTCCT